MKSTETLFIPEQLRALEDLEYRDFLAGLLPRLEKERIIGVRTPALRALAKTLQGTGEAEAFLSRLPHFYFEENNLHGFLLARMKDFDKCLEKLNLFLPWVDNWATCDQLRPLAFRSRPPQLLPAIRDWMADSSPFTARFGLEMLMTHYLGQAFQTEYLQWAAAVNGRDYYVRMMVAWFFATALSKQPEAAFPYFQPGQLEEWTRRKAVSKALESRAVASRWKEKLRAL